MHCQGYQASQQPLHKRLVAGSYFGAKSCAAGLHSTLSAVISRGSSAEDPSSACMSSVAGPAAPILRAVVVVHPVVVAIVHPAAPTKEPSANSSAILYKLAGTQQAQ